MGKSKKADYPAIVIGYRGESGTIYIEDAIMRKVNIDTTVNNIFNIYERHNLDYMGVEFVAFQEVLKNWIDDKSKALGKYLSIKGYSPRGSKDTRIKSLVPLTQNGTIKFNAKKTLGGFKATNDMTILIEQFLNYPKNHDDWAKKKNNARCHLPSITCRVYPIPQNPCSHLQLLPNPPIINHFLS